MLFSLDREIITNFAVLLMIHDCITIMYDCISTSCIDNILTFQQCLYTILYPGSLNDTKINTLKS